ncbi:MAG: amino acid permease [Nanoarchaeota archaeon]|nr:amino acid permease [Nanoarchaeota archaeon]MBU1622019.1 amino acid permease [Nanoarchaeota archaeon]MBU1974020.1 amino acid permease [Nanoarchaeota archaeon]
MLKKRGQVEKGFFANHKLAMASFTLIGTIVGAGILGIPYVVAQAGFLYGFLLMIFLGVAFLFLNLFMGEVVLRTKEQHQLTGYAEKYLGKWGKRAMTFSMIVAIYGALTAYLIGEGATLYSIFGAGSPLLFTLIFFAICFFIIYRGIKATGKVEFILITLLFLVIFLIGILSFDKIEMSNLVDFNPAYIFLPYGVVLFALMGSPAIPELQEVLGKQKKLMKKAIIIGSLTPAVLYIVFTFFIVGIIGLDNFSLLEPNQRIATIALSIYSQPLLGLFANLLAVLAMFTSFLTLGLALVDMYRYDYGLSRKLSLLLTFSFPLLIALFNFTTFITVLGLTGAIAGGLDGILVTLMFWKAKLLGDRKPEYVLGKHRIIGTIIIFMFAFGVLYQLWTRFF